MRGVRNVIKRIEPNEEAQIQALLQVRFTIACERDIYYISIITNIIIGLYFLLSCRCLLFKKGEDLLEKHLL